MVSKAKYRTMKGEGIKTASEARGIERKRYRNTTTKTNAAQIIDTTCKSTSCKLYQGEKISQKNIQ